MSFNRYLRRVFGSSIYKRPSHMQENNLIFSFSVCVPLMFFSCLMALLKLSELYWVTVVKVVLLVWLWKLMEMFPTSLHSLWCWTGFVKLLKLRNVASVLNLLKVSINTVCCVSLNTFSFWIHWDNSEVFILQFANTVYYMYWFVNDKTPLHPMGKPWLI